MGRGDIDDSAPTGRFHRRQHRGGGVKRTGQIDRDHRVPAVGGKILDLGDVLDTGVVNQNVDAAEGRLSRLDHRGDGRRVAHIGVVIGDGRPGIGGQIGARAFDVIGRAKAV